MGGSNYGHVYKTVKFAKMDPKPVKRSEISLIRVETQLDNLLLL